MEYEITYINIHNELGLTYLSYCNHFDVLFIKFCLLVKLRYKVYIRCLKNVLFM